MLRPDAEGDPGSPIDTGARTSGSSTTLSSDEGYPMSSDEDQSAGPVDLTTTPDGAQPDQREAESAARQRILEAAAAVFREKGFTGTRVVDIARRAGYTPGALYGYFESRAELLAEAIANSSGEMLAGLLGVLAEHRPVAAAPDDGAGASSDAVTAAAPAAVLRAVLDQLERPIDESDQMLLDGVALAQREPVARDRLAVALGRFRATIDGSGEGQHQLAEGGADLLVVLVLGITAARALGLHDPVPSEMRELLTRCLQPSLESAEA